VNEEKPLLLQLGARIRRLRQQLGLSIAELAARSRVSPRLVSELQAGRANISLAGLIRVANALNTSSGKLLGEAEDDSRESARRPTVISLLGIRGAGKTTIGAGLAKNLGIPFVELDRQIETEAGLALADIFALHGEVYYRDLERRALRRVLDERRSLVVATGGGIVTNPEAFKLLDDRTITVWLKASADQHWNRVIRQGDPRPMAGRPAAKAELRRLLAEREPLYRGAQVRIDTVRLGIEGSVSALAAKLARAMNRN
jgi:XRE family aerobic/anaerobic benzoate catabolism transcriptional regulator